MLVNQIGRDFKDKLVDCRHAVALRIYPLQQRAICARTEREVTSAIIAFKEYARHIRIVGEFSHPASTGIP